MHIAYVAPPHFPVPPPEYGGIARGAEELARYTAEAGHEVSVLASGDSDLRLPGVQLIPTVSRSIGRLTLSPEGYKKSMHDAEDAILAIAPTLDADVMVVRWERYRLAHHLGELCKVPLVMSFCCGPSANEESSKILSELSPYVLYTAHTKAHKDSLGDYPEIEVWPIGVDMRGVEPSRYSLSQTDHQPTLDVLRKLRGADYVAQIGLIRNTKGQRTARQIARAANLPIIFAGAPKPSDYEGSVRYFEEEVEGYVDNKSVFSVGPVDSRTRNELMAYARCTVFASGFEAPYVEAFGRVLAESASVGTPVVGYRSGSFPEVIEQHGLGLGFSTLDEGVAQLGRVRDIDRERCAKVARQFLSSEALIPAFVQRIIDFATSSKSA